MMALSGQSTKTRKIFFGFELIKVDLIDIIHILIPLLTLLIPVRQTKSAVTTLEQLRKITLVIFGLALITAD
jgi:hypothetical protein